MINQEIERKFLVRTDEFMQAATKVSQIQQGYLSVLPTVRVRLMDFEAFLTIKGPSDMSGLSRQEWEYRIPVQEAQALMKLCAGRTVSKRRYLVPYVGRVWEVDVFDERHSGLIIAELELRAEDDSFELPDWLGREVTGDKRYYNASLALKLELPPLE